MAGGRGVLPLKCEPNHSSMTHSTLRRRSSRTRRPDMNLQPGPRTATINAILNYSKALKVMDMPPVGQVHIVLN